MKVRNFGNIFERFAW